MLLSKIETMKPLLESVSGIHMTAYITNQGSLSDLKKQIGDALKLAEDHLSPVMTPVERSKFLEPIRLFQQNGKRLKSFSGNIGIFRTEKSFRVLSLPFEVEKGCIVANSFHVKPLLKWMQIDREFLFLGLDSETASLYQGDLYTLRLIDTAIYPESLRTQGKDGSTRRGRLNETMEWLSNWITQIAPSERPRLFLAGDKELTRALVHVLQYENISSVPIWSTYSQQKTQDICFHIRSILRAEAKKSFERAMVEFHYAADINQAKGNVFAIAKAAVQGKIKKLLIADSIKIFGKLNRKSGELKLHGRDLDHEDDDILDDIAQTVLAYGGEVTVATRGEIPKGRPILAIMDEPSQPEVSQPLKYQERIAL